MDSSGMKNKENFLNDEDISKLDRYKNVRLLKAINECNMYVQNGALITMIDNIKGKYSVANRTTESLYTVMDYVNRCSIPREAIIEILCNLFRIIEDKQLTPDDTEFHSVSFSISILHHLLLENTSCKIYCCKKGFTPTSPINDSKEKLKRGDILYFMDVGYFSYKSKEYYLYVFFDVFNGSWYYVSEDELSHLREENIK